MKTERDDDRRAWRRRHPHRRGLRGAPYPHNLSKMPPFGKWLEVEVETAVAAGSEVPDVVQDISIPPKYECKKFRSMWAFGSRFRVASCEQSLQTQDFGVAATFTRPWRASARDQNVVEADVEYIGELEEIVELDYRQSCVVVFVCRWVRANYRGQNATVRRDRWGFTIANFDSCERFGRESFAFPQNCQQLFFSDVLERPGWRVVLRREVRGQRVHNSRDDCGRSLLFPAESDNDYEGLRAPPSISEDMPLRRETAREVERDNLFHERERAEQVFDEDLGDSSQSD